MFAEEGKTLEKRSVFCRLGTIFSWYVVEESPLAITHLGYVGQTATIEAPVWPQRFLNAVRVLRGTASAWVRSSKGNY